MHVASDIAVIAAGSNPAVGKIAAGFREQGTPVLVVAENAEAVRGAAIEAGYAIPDEDLISLGEGEALNDELRGTLADEIGTWIVRADAEKRLAFSIAYPFVRRPLAYESIRATSLQNAGVGVVVFVPGADMPIMTANQAKMVLQIAAAYGHSLSADRVKEIAGVIAGGFVFRGVSRQLAGAIPALGWAVKGTMGYVGTQAIGHAAIEYFEGGGDVAGLAALVGKSHFCCRGNCGNGYQQACGENRCCGCGSEGEEGCRSCSECRCARCPVGSESCMEIPETRSQEQGQAPVALLLLWLHFGARVLF